MIIKRKGREMKVSVSLSVNYEHFLEKPNAFTLKPNVLLLLSSTNSGDQPLSRHHHLLSEEWTQRDQASQVLGLRFLQNRTISKIPGLSYGSTGKELLEQDNPVNQKLWARRKQTTRTGRKGSIKRNKKKPRLSVALWF